VAPAAMELAVNAEMDVGSPERQRIGLEESGNAAGQRGEVRHRLSKGPWAAE
jgi:hypothetical protein